MSTCRGWSDSVAGSALGMRTATFWTSDAPAARRIAMDGPGAAKALVAPGASSATVATRVIARRLVNTFTRIIPRCPYISQAFGAWAAVGGSEPLHQPQGLGSLGGAPGSGGLGLAHGGGAGDGGAGAGSGLDQGGGGGGPGRDTTAAAACDSSATLSRSGGSTPWITASRYSYAARKRRNMPPSESPGLAYASAQRAAS